MLKILIVDDQASGRESLQVLLSSLDFQVATAHDLDAALAVAEQFAPDVAIIDWFLTPDATGGQVAHQLRETLPDLQVIFSTGADAHLVKSGLPSAQVLTKPFHVGQLLSMIGG